MNDEWKNNSSLPHILVNAPYITGNFNADFTSPFSCLISGPSSSGKSTFIKKLIDLSSTHITPPPQRIVYVYSEWQPLFEGMKNVEFKKSIPSLQEFEKFQYSLLIIDDFMNEVNETISKFFTKGSHHRNISVIFVTQNLFHKGNHFRSISLNSQYIIVFKNPRDSQQIQFLARSIFTDKSKRLVEAYTHATSKPYGYLLIDLRQTTPSKYMLRTWVLNDHPQGKAHQLVYYPKI